MIRTVNPTADAPGIADIYNRYIRETTVSFETEPLSAAQMRERIDGIADKYPYYVYETDGTVAGYAYVHPWKERAAYSGTLETTIYLDPSHKHMGIGSKLMKHIADECRRRGYRVLIACITGENTESIAFHKALGFRQASLFHNVGYKLGRLLDVVDMEYQL